MTVSDAQLTAIATDFGTPAYVYDAAVVRARLTALREGFGELEPRVFYSLKANPAPGVAALMVSLGLGLDACSAADLRVASHARVDRSQVSYASLAAPPEELAQAAAVAGTIVLDDADDLARLPADRDGVEFGLRITPGINAGFHSHVHAGAADSKFGVPLGLVGDFLARANARGVEISGIHAHIGSDVSTADPYLQLLGAILGAATPQIRWVNLGGGFGTPRTASDPAFPWDVLGPGVRRLLTGTDLELRLEPGAYLTMDAGVLLTRVQGVKPAHGPRPRTVIVDGNTSHLTTALMYRSHHPVRAVGVDAGDRSDCRVVGNLMQAGDVLADDAQLPFVERGALVAIGLAGAYASSRASTFNSRPRPAEVLVDGDSVTLLRRAETVDDLLARDAPSPGGASGS